MIQLASIQLLYAFIMIIISATMLFSGIALTENILNTQDVLVVNDNSDDINATNESKYLNDNSVNTEQDNYYLRNNNSNDWLTMANNSDSVHLLAYSQEKLNLYNSNTQSTLFSHINADRAPPLIT